MEQVKQRVEGSQDLQLVYDRPLKVGPSCSAECRNTNDGSPSEVSVKNLSSQNKVEISIVLGRQSKRYTIYPKETVRFPEEGPKDFEGMTLRISNTNSYQNDATAEVLLTTNR